MQPPSLSETQNDDIRFKRTDNIRRSIKVSLISKAVGGILQFGVVPFAIARLGSQYEVFSALLVLMSTLSVLNLGIGPGLTMELSRLAHRSDEEEEKRVFASAMLLVLGFAGVL